MKKAFRILSIAAAVLLLLSSCGSKKDGDDKQQNRTGESPETKPYSSMEDASADGKGTTLDMNSDSADKNTVSSKGYEIVVKDGLTYVGGVLIANKTYSLPEDYAPGVTSEAEEAVNKMEEAAKEDGLELFVRSGYRSYSYQSTLYNNYVSRDGKAAADRYSARPGHSEHQTGMAFDMNSLSQSFEDTPEGKWLARNCWRYGFIIRYPKEKESITGYMYEPWHVRYLGTELAEKVYNSGLTLEEYLGITSEYAD